MDRDDFDLHSASPRPEEGGYTPSWSDEEEYARRVLREVRHVESGASVPEQEPVAEPPQVEPPLRRPLHEEDYEQLDIEAERLEREEREQREQCEDEEEEAKNHRRRISTFWQLVSGAILVREGVSKYYPYMLTVALMFLGNIFVIFTALYSDIQYSKREKEVQRLRERYIHFEEQRLKTTTHSAIERELRRRGIPLYEPSAPNELIEK